MMFQVKATLERFLGDLDTYPCHFGHRPGDEVLFDGEKFIGRLCPDVWPLLTPKVMALHAAGPRYVDPAYYYPFWYAPCSRTDFKMKKYDGLGYRNVLRTVEVPPFNMANLAPENAFKWPPHPEKTVLRGVSVVCPDLRSSAVFRLEAFDLSEKGFDTPYFRRQMVILHKIHGNQKIEESKILDTFSGKSRTEIYPALSPQIMAFLLDELEVMGYIRMEGGKTSITKAGMEKLDTFRSSLSDEEREGLEI